MLDKLKQLTKDTAVYGISTIVGRFINFLLVPFYTNIFAPADYGIVANVYAFIALLNIVFIYGMDSAYLKFAASDEFEDKRATYSTAYIVLTATSLLLAALLYFARQPLGAFLSTGVLTGTVFICLPLILLADTLAVIPFITLRLKRKAMQFALLKFANIIITVLLNLLLLLHFTMGVEAVFYANLAASVVTLLMLLPVIAGHLRFTVELPLLRRMVTFGLPYLPGGLAAMVMQVIDRPIIEKLAGLKTLGIYQANYRLGIFMMLFVSMFQYAWQPFFLSHAKDKDAPVLFGKVFTFFTFAGTVILVLLSLFIEDFARLSIGGRHIIGPAYWGGLHIVPIVLLAYLFNGFYVNFSAGLYIKEKSLPVPVIMGLGAVVNVAANFLLVPVWGITGAALATLASYMVMSAGFFIVSARLMPVVYEWGRLLRLALLLSAAAGVFYGFPALFSGQLPAKILLLLLFAASLFGAGVVNAASVKLLLQQPFKRK